MRIEELQAVIGKVHRPMRPRRTEKSGRVSLRRTKIFIQVQTPPMKTEELIPYLFPSFFHPEMVVVERIWPARNFR